MESACPKCKKKTEHEDYLFEVQCSDCGTRYNPFFDSVKQVEGEEPAADSLEAIDPIAQTNDFKESTTAFQEIVQFGETLQEPPSTGEVGTGINPSDFIDPPAEPAAPALRATPAPKPKAKPAAGGVVSDSDMLMTSGDLLSGYRIGTFFPPQSVWADVSQESQDPLEVAFAALWEKASEKGANAVVAIQWRFTPDGSRILVSGTPVRCEKE